jgi:O-antigen/teichoic acid export membrane protein
MMDPIILNKLASAFDVTCFYLGSVVFNQIQQTSGFAMRPLQPVLTTFHARGSKPHLRNAFLRGGRYGLWAALFIAVPLIIYRREVVTLWVGERYLTAATVMALLLALFPIGSGNAMAPQMAHATAQMRPWMLRALVVQVSNLFLTLYLVGVMKMGAVGSALATLVALGTASVFLYLPLGLRMVEARVGQWLRETLWPGVQPALTAAIVWASLRDSLRPSSAMAIGGCLACGWLCYVVVLLVFSLRDRDRGDLSRGVARMKFLGATGQAVLQKIVRSGAKTT